MTVDDEMLLAYVDGELDAAQTARIDAEAQADPILARRIETHRRLNASIGGVFGEVMAEQPPDRLIEAIGKARQAAEVVDLQAARRQRAAPAAAKAAPTPWARWGLLAASALIVVGVGYRMTSHGGPGGAMVSGPPGAMVAQGPLTTALNDRLALTGVKPGDAVRVGVSFRATDGHYCRTFQVTVTDTAAGGFAKPWPPPRGRARTTARPDRRRRRRSPRRSRR